jgi:hypothetical protein
MLGRSGASAWSSSVSRTRSDASGCASSNFTVLENHLHLIVEADSTVELSRWMQGLGVRIARALNCLTRRRGRSSPTTTTGVLKAGTELVNAIAYVLGNAHHYGERGSDRFSSAAYDPGRRERVPSHPCAWLFPHGWRRARRVPPWLATVAPRWARASSG